MTFKCTQAPGVLRATMDFNGRKVFCGEKMQHNGSSNGIVMICNISDVPYVKSFWKGNEMHQWLKNPMCFHCLQLKSM